MPTVIRGSDNIDTSNVATQTELDNIDNNLRDYTILADYPTQKNNGTITLSEAATNFEEIVVVASDSSETMITTTIIPTTSLRLTKEYEFFPNLTRYSRWVYTNTTTFTSTNQADSWINRIYGRRRIV